MGSTVMRIGGLDFADPLAVGHWVRSVAEKRGLRERRAMFLEYWLQVELWRSLKDRASNETVFDCEPPYWTHHPVTGKGHWKGADIGATTGDGKACLFIEMKHAMWLPRFHRRHTRQIAKDIKALMGLDLARTAEGLSNGEITQARYSIESVSLFRPWGEKWKTGNATVGFIGLLTPRSGAGPENFLKDVGAAFTGPLVAPYTRGSTEWIPLWDNDSLIVWVGSPAGGAL